ncbi:M48 family metalloprotease [Mesorhizobium sp. YM1C-6-2]|uniref:M48 family metalloprotease n=1 Tax=Mesorhizobium sp. YM1C-6-2 TaxID=1827501 RepID=UPI000EF18267|nr:M48 family metalloprotease [Mesorhizobium sp. YM1C-6-2]RLP24990.1 M48 family peptidase [Mesorhizobium sp. YM1C-6-2]
MTLLLRSTTGLVRAAAALLLALLVASASVVAAHAQSVPVVRDAEIEALVRDYARPIFKAAGLSKSGIDIILVNDQRFNAFVAGRRMFINTGALLQAGTPNEIIGVIAHEAGHIAGGHQDRLREQIARAQTMAVISSLLGVGAMVAGAATDTGGLASAGAGLMAGGTEAARRGLLGYQRSEESAADQSAIRYLEATGQSGNGMLVTFERFQSALSLSGTKVDPYQLSHPTPRDRIANLETLVKSSPHFGNKDSEALQQRHDMMRAKIAVYTQGQAAASRLFKKMPGSLAAQYGEAQAALLFGNPRNALKKADALIKIQPKNPYFQELRGDVLLRANEPEKAAEAYARAVQLDPAKSGILQISYGQALIATGKTESLKKAVNVIQEGLSRDKENFNGYAYLAQAYGQLGEVPEAELATAEGYYYGGNYQQAKIFAMRAQQKFKRGAPGWVRAQDIINYKTPKKKK